MDTFDRIVCGIDASFESDVALMHTLRLSTDTTHIVLTHVFAPTAINEAELMLGETWENHDAEAREMLGAVRSWAVESSNMEAGQIETRVVPGPKAKGLLELATHDAATLICIGSHGRSRLSGAIRGSVASNALHSAPCSVLIARQRPQPERAGEATAALRVFPDTVVCGVDGSPGSQRAVEVTQDIAARVGCSVRYVAAEDGNDVVLSDVAKQVPTRGELTIEPGRPIDVLLEASQMTDLLVLGSRGLGGARAIGSVSERVAHDADSSVLVVRPLEARS
jgi:nucleotide-binding universal stress UspA family protein